MPHAGRAGNQERSNDTGNTEPSTATSGNSIRRRKLLKMAGASGGLAALAGCTGSFGGGGGSQSLHIGATIPRSGPFGYAGEKMEKSLELAAKQATETDIVDFDGDIEITYKDTETDPGVARRRASELVNEGADFLIGSVSSSVALSIGELAQREGLIYVGMGGSNALTGSQCRPNFFNASYSGSLQTGASLGYLLQEGVANRVYTITLDYEYGQNLLQWETNQLIPQFDAEHVGNSFIPFDKRDYSQVISEAMNSDSDFVMFNVVGSPMVPSMIQANEFGLIEDRHCSWVNVTLLDAPQVPNEVFSHEHYHPGGLPWYWQIDTPATNEFHNQFLSEYGESNIWLGAMIYAGALTTIDGVAQAGSSDANPLRSELEGKTIKPALWGEDKSVTWRPCDHAMAVPAVALDGRPASEIDPTRGNYFKVLDTLDNVEEKWMRSCEQTGCTF